MAYMNYTPGAAGGSAMTVSPAGGGARASVPGGGDPNAAFMEMLAMARADKLKRQREQEATASREMLMREGQVREQAGAELGRRQFAERELAGSERGQAQRLALEGSRTRSGLRGERLQQKGEEARQRAATSRIPMREFGGFGAVHTTGKIARPNEMTALERQAHGFSGYNIPPRGG